MRALKQILPKIDLKITPPKVDFKVTPPPKKEKLTVTATSTTNASRLRFMSDEEFCAWLGSWECKEVSKLDDQYRWAWLTYPKEFGGDPK